MRKCKPMSELFITVQPYIDHCGYFVVFGAILLEDFGMPVPGETLLIAGALLASRGKMDIVTLLWTACIVAITGDNIGYAIGRLGGRGLVFRYGRYGLITAGRLRKSGKNIFGEASETLRIES
jgi:membrane protein DedA with SNARE-associated domain